MAFNKKTLVAVAGSADIHYVQDNPLDLFPRVTAADVAAMTDTVMAGEAWKGDRLNLCGVLRTLDAGLIHVSYRVSDLVSEEGYRIGAGAVEVWFQKYVRASIGSPISRQYDTCRYIAPTEEIADILYTQGAVNLPAHFVQPVWFLVNVPADAFAGVYRGSVTFFAPSGDRATLDLKVTVKNALLPARENWHYDMEIFHWPGSFLAHYGYTEEQFYQPETLEIMRPHYRRLYEAGCNTAWALMIEGFKTGIFYKDHNGPQVKWLLHRDGSLDFDFSDFCNWVPFMRSIGFTKMVCDGLCPGWRGWCMTDADTDEDINMPMTAADPAWKGYVTQFLRALYAVCEEHGWSDMILIHIDERPYDELRELIDVIKEITDGKFRVSLATNHSNMDIPILDEVPSLSINVNLVNDITRPQARRRREELGARTSIYNCTTNFPNCFVRDNPVESVWAVWDTLRNEMDGFLRWAYDLANDDPLRHTDTPDFESGDQLLVYPGNRTSTRFERLCEGVRDAVKVEAMSAADAGIAADLRAAMDAMVPLYVLCHNEQNGDALGNAAELAHIFAPKGAIVAVKDEFGSPYDPRRVSVADEVAKLKAALSAATDAYAAGYGAPEDTVTAVAGLYPTEDAAACVNIPVALRDSVTGVAFAGEGTVRVTFADGTAAEVAVTFAAAPVFEGSVNIYDL